MYNLSDASMAWMAVAFCVLLVVVGSFFLLNVILAVIMESFDKVDRQHDIIEEQKRIKLKQLKRAYDIYDDTEEELAKEDEEGKEDEDGNKSLDEPQPVNLKPSIKIDSLNNMDATKDVGQKGDQLDQTEMAQINSIMHGTSDQLDFSHNVKKNSARVEPSMEQLLGQSGNESQTAKLLQEAKKDDSMLKMNPDIPTRTKKSAAVHPSKNEADQHSAFNE